MIRFFFSVLLVAQSLSPTERRALENVVDLSSISNVNRTQQYVYVDTHINPSAGQVVVLSRDAKVLGVLDGWTLKILPNEGVIYHKSQPHFVPTHSVEIAIFDPRMPQEKQIYPPRPYQPVRTDFIRRVGEEYKKRGEEWFKKNNHHMDPERFDSSIQGGITVDPAARSLSFHVRYGDPDNALDPLPFKEDIIVTCARIDRIERLQCSEQRQ